MSVGLWLHVSMPYPLLAALAAGVDRRHAKL